MSVIANFKKRREALRAQQVEAKTRTQAPENEALTLLAAVLKCDERDAIEVAKRLVEEAETKGFEFVIGFDFADGEDSSASLMVKAEAAALDASAAQVEDAAATVDAAADNVNSAAGELEDATGKLADTADGIGQATEELKKATDELKKSSAARPSSRGGKAAAQKSS